MKSTRELAKSVLVRISPRLLAHLEYRFEPRLRDSLGGGPFNGQLHRQRIFRDIVGTVPLEAIVETGTFRGSTAEYMAESTNLPIITVEERVNFYEYARLRLARFDHVTGTRGDSRALLRRLRANPTFPNQNVFFYLDAHWYDDLPLRDELQLITGHWSGAIIMVDDFQVPGDPGYRFDDYGPDKRLTLDYVEPSRFGLQAFFPAVPSSEETGACRGCVVFGDAASAPMLARIGSLRPHGG